MAQIRAGESVAESQGYVLSNPVSKTSIDCGLSERGKVQVVRQTYPALRQLANGDASAWLWPSIALNAYQTAEILAALVGIGRNRIVPEYSLLDARGVGALDRGFLDTVAADVSKGDTTYGPDWRPPKGVDGTPNESISDVLVRARQLLSITETQYYGDTVFIIAPDSANLSILQAGVLGIDLRNHDTLRFAPGEALGSLPALAEPAEGQQGQEPRVAVLQPRKARQGGHVQQQAFPTEQMLLAEGSGWLATDQAAMAPEGVLAGGEEQELDNEKLLLNVASIAAVAGLAGFLATSKKGAEEAEEALQAQMQVESPNIAQLLKANAGLAKDLQAREAELKQAREQLQQRGTQLEELRQEFALMAASVQGLQTELDREKRGKALLEQTQGSEQATLEAARREAAAVGEALQRAKQTRDAALAELEQLKQAQAQAQQKQSSQAQNQAVAGFEGSRRAAEQAQQAAEHAQQAEQAERSKREAAQGEAAELRQMLSEVNSVLDAERQFSELLSAEMGVLTTQLQAAASATQQLKGRNADLMTALEQAAGLSPGSLRSRDTSHGQQGAGSAEVDSMGAAEAFGGAESGGEPSSAAGAAAAGGNNGVEGAGVLQRPSRE
ncbi:hypothetical protein N2152v2_004161 [Parachlorella kessleri]